MNLFRFVGCLFHGHNLECKTIADGSFKVCCTKCGMTLGKVNHYTELKVVVAITEDGKHYEVYGCSALDLVECNDKVVESLRAWYGGHYTLSTLTVGVNTDKLK